MPARTCSDFRRTLAHTDRRSFVKAGILGAAGLSLADVLRAEDRGARGTHERVNSVIILWMRGGPSHHDTWDPKPDAPAEVRGEFRPIATSVPGIRITEHLPLVSRQAHRITVVRSMTHAAVNHNAATYLVTTGSPPPREQIAFTPTENDFPHLGAQVALGRPAAGAVPTAVSLPDPVGDGPYPCPGQNGGFLGASYAPLAVHGDPDDEAFTMPGLEEVTDRRRASIPIGLRSSAPRSPMAAATSSRATATPACCAC